MRPVDVVRRLCPHAKSSYVSAFENGDALFRKAGITTPIRLAHFLAQAFHETGGLTIEWESGSYSAERLVEVFGSEPRHRDGTPHHSAEVTPSEAKQLARNGPAIFERVYGLGNPKKAKELGNSEKGDGWKYRGGGILQTTGRGNYRRMGVKCNVDFEGHPELVLSAEHALKPALAEWTEGNLNVAADRDDILAITKKINGGTNGLDDRRDWYRRIKPLITTVDLKDLPAPPPKAPVAEDSKTKTVAKGAVAGGTVVAGGIAASSAHSTALAIALFAAAALIGVGIFFFMHRKKDNQP